MTAIEHAVIPAPEPRPGPDQVLLYRAEVPSLSSAVVARLDATLSSDEQERAARFVRDKDRAVFVAAHALLRHALGSVLEGAMRFRTTAYGKPELDLPFDHGIHFNLSHTEGMVACAVCRGHPVGVDVEAIDPGVDIGMLAERYFAASEHGMLAGTPPERRAELFFRLWTLKEAMLKAVGTGLATPLRTFVFTADPATSALRLTRPETASAWQVREYAPTPVHRLAIALRRSAARPFAVVSRLIPLEMLSDTGR